MDVKMPTAIAWLSIQIVQLMYTLYNTYKIEYSTQLCCLSQSMHMHNIYLCVLEYAFGCWLHFLPPNSLTPLKTPYGSPLTFRSGKLHLKRLLSTRRDRTLWLKMYLKAIAWWRRSVSIVRRKAHGWSTNDCVETKRQRQEEMPYSALKKQPHCTRISQRKKDMLTSRMNVVWGRGWEFEKRISRVAIWSALKCAFNRIGNSKM